MKRRRFAMKKTPKIKDAWARIAVSLDADSKTAQLINAIFDAYENKEAVLLDDVVKHEFELIKPQIAEDLEKNKERSAINSNNIKKRWEEKRQKKATQKNASFDNVQYAEVIEQYPFGDFWNAYDKMRDRKGCEFTWQRLSDTDKANIMQHVTKYVASTPNKKYRKDPITYLKNRSWEDEIITDTPQNNGNNNVQYNNRLVQQQRNNEVLRNIMAEAAAAVRPRNPIETTGAGSL